MIILSVDRWRRPYATAQPPAHERTHHQMLSFNVGDRVRFHRRGTTRRPGVIIKYNRKTVTVVADDQHHWNVAPVFLSRLVDPQSPGADTARLIRLPIKP